jgi:NAD-dependent DNA ligase
MVSRLTLSLARRRAERLRSTIRRHDHRCYVLDRPTISDGPSRSASPL